MAFDDQRHFLLQGHGERFYDEGKVEIFQCIIVHGQNLSDIPHERKIYKHDLIYSRSTDF
ncbi:hypothetical protein D3C81_1311040 [compost metagenome]